MIWNEYIQQDTAVIQNGVQSSIQPEEAYVARPRNAKNLVGRLQLNSEKFYDFFPAQVPGTVFEYLDKQKNIGCMYVWNNWQHQTPFSNNATVYDGKVIARQCNNSTCNVVLIDNSATVDYEVSCNERIRSQEWNVKQCFLHKEMTPIKR